MAKYIVRIELFGRPPGQDYGSLHWAMERRHFSRTIQGDNGILYDLPTATYFIETALDRMAVLSAAKQAANAVWKDNSVLVDETTSLVWDGLRQHSAPKPATILNYLLSGQTSESFRQ